MIVCAACKSFFTLLLDSLTFLCGVTTFLGRQMLLQKEFARLVRTTHQGTGRNVQKPHGFRLYLPFLKFLRCDVVTDRQVFPRGLQVLPKRHHITSGGAQIDQRLTYLFIGFGQTEHQRRFRDWRCF